MDRLAKYAPNVLGVTRVLLGILFACHGAQKLLGTFLYVAAQGPGAWALDNRRLRGA